VTDPVHLQDAVAAAGRFADGLGGRPLVIAGPDVQVNARRVVHDLRPGMGLLGALYTGLAAADTPEILFVGPRYWDAPVGLLAALVAAGPRSADVVYPRVSGHAEPALAVYGHRCLSAIQAALLSGEFKLTGWWGQVRTAAVEEPWTTGLERSSSEVEPRPSRARTVFGHRVRGAARNSQKSSRSSGSGAGRG
jgi:hypothetical protein